VDLGRAGECTDTFIKGGLAKDCPENVAAPAQLAEAEAFLATHAGLVRLITVQVGSDNLFGALPAFMTSTAAQQQAMVTKLLSGMAHDWGVIFSALRKACPSCQIVALNQYNPYPKGAIPVDLSPLFQQYTQLLQQAAAPAKVQVADISAPFVGHEQAYTWIAQQHPDPTTAGFTAIAQAVAKVVAAGQVAAGATWQPKPGTTWMYETGDTPNLSKLAHVQVYDIDGFDNPASTVAALHAKGIMAVCYMDAGIWESVAPDAGNFPAALLGKSAGGSPDLKWIDLRQSGPDYSTLQEIMQARAQTCKSSGFDAIDWDMVGVYQESPSFPITAADQLAYNTFLANTTHSLGLAVGLHDDGDQVAALQPKFDFAVSEECFKYAACSAETPFISAGKAVFEVEYSDDGMTTSKFCSQANAMHFSAALATSDLDGTAWKPCW